MVNILIIAHAEIAKSFVCCIEHILNKKVDGLYILPVDQVEDAEQVLVRARALIEQVGVDREILILTDIYGATPSNISQKLIKPDFVELITGLNLSMLIRAISYAKCGLKVCVEKALDGGTSGIIHVGVTT